MMLADPQTTWHAADITWADGTTRRLELAGGTALWNQSGEPALPIRWVLSRGPAGLLGPRAFSPETTDEAAWVVAQFAKRRTVEVTLEESRAHLGIETQRQWSDRSIERETPCVLGLYSVVALLARAISAGREIPVRAAAWYPKGEATCADCLALVRSDL